MIEQEKLKHLLKRMIDETENNHFSSTDELIRFIANELQKTKLMIENR